MTDRYVNPAVGASGTGGSWAQAYKTLKEATDAAAAGEPIYFANGTADTLITSTQYTVAAGVRIISTSDTTNNPPTTYASGAKVTSSTAGANMIINGGTWLGCAFEQANTGDILFGQADAGVVRLESCEINFATGSTSASLLSFGLASSALNVDLEIVNTNLSTVNTGQGITLAGDLIWRGGTFGGTNPPAALILAAGRCLVRARFEGCDLSAISNTLVAGSTTLVSDAEVSFTNCKLHASVTPLGASSTVGVDVYLRDCHSGDTHYAMAHYGYNGSTVATTDVRANAGATYDGTNTHSWLVSSNANASLAHPYYSPWVDQYNAGGSAISPNLECVRSGSSTAYKDDEIWAEFLVKTTSGSTKTTWSNDRCAPLATAANQTTGALAGGDWTGENATSWFGKLGGASVTPAEIGYMRARVAIGKASVTDLYVDPKIRTS